MTLKKLKTVILAAVMALTLICAPALSACDNGGDGTATITYSTGEGATQIQQLKAKSGSKIYPPVDPEREGYRFDYWELNGHEYEFTVMPEKDITLNAKWNKLYTVTYSTGEGAETIASEKYVAGEAVDLPETVTRAHYKFAGWLDGSTPFTAADPMPARDLTLTASWVAANTITFSTGISGINVAPLVEVAGEAIVPPAVNRPGYHVKYWKLNGEKFDFTTMPDTDVTLTAEWEELTNLPAMFIDLNVPLSSVDRKTYVNGRITVTNTEDEYLLNSVSTKFKGRGNGSWTDSGDKKGYKIKFDNKQSLFGREANKHWVVIACANFSDPTMYRNYLAYNMAGEVFTDIEYSTCAYWLDLYVNGEYRGVYLLCEHVRVAEGRVNITSDYVTEPEHNGFLIEYDAYGNQPNADKGETVFIENVNYFWVAGLKYPFTVKSPDPEDYAAEGLTEDDFKNQVAYIKDYVSRVYKAALAGDYNTFKDLADANSFIDMYILHELFKNMDTGYSSFFLYKKPDGKLYAGPPWDFDGSTNADDGNGRGDRTSQGLYIAEPDSTQAPDITRSELYISLYKVSAFKSAVKARWKQLSPQIKTFLDERMNDTVYATNKAAMGKNYAKWENKTQTAAENDWVNDCTALKKWFTDRIAWLDKEWK